MFKTFLLGMLLGGSAHATEAFLTQENFLTQIRSIGKLEHIESRFHQIKTLTHLSLTLESKGKIKINRLKPQVIWEIQEPSWTQVILTKKAIEIKTGLRHKPQVQKITTENIGGHELSKNLQPLMAWLTLDGKLLYESYWIKQVQRRPPTFLFIPKNVEHDIFKEITMTLDRRGALSSLQILEKSGDTLKITFR